jgi:hypothetical protein
VQHIEDLNDLPHGIGGPGLLTIPKSRVGDPHMFGRVRHDKFIIKIYPGNFLIGINLPHEIGLIHFLKPVLPTLGVFMIQEPPLQIPASHGCSPIKIVTSYIR